MRLPAELTKMIYFIFLFFAQVITAVVVEENTVVYIVRHAEADGGHLSASLSSWGQQQAQHIKNVFSGSPYPDPIPDKLIATDINRCTETLKPISIARALPILRCKTGISTTQRCFKNSVVTGKTHLYALRSSEMRTFVTSLGATVTAGCPSPSRSYDQVWKVSWRSTGAKTFECSTMTFPS